MPNLSPSSNSYWWTTTAVASSNTIPATSPPPSPPPVYILPQQEDFEFEVGPSTYSGHPEGELEIRQRVDGALQAYPWANLKPENLRRLAAAVNLALVKHGRESLDSA